MKVISCISTGLFIVASACIMKKDIAAQHEKLYDTKWSLKKITTVSGTEPVSTKAFIRFNKEKNSAGGNGSCNSFGSTATVDKNQVSFSEIFSTKMYCEQVQQTENQFLGNLRKVNRFEVDDNKLRLFENKTLLLEFTAETL